MKRVLISLCLFGLAMPAGADDLLATYRRARDSDLTWAQARANYDALSEKAPQGRSQLLPIVGLSASTINTRDQRIETPMGTSTYSYNTKGYALSLTQPLFRKQAFAAYSQGKADAAKAAFDLANADQDLILRVTRAYFDVLAAEDVLDFARSEKSAIERLLALAQRNFNVGTASLVDVHEAQARYDLAVAQEIAAANDLEVKREALRVVMGDEPGVLAKLTGKLELAPPQPANMDSWVDAARNDNPQVKSQEQALASAKQELEKSRGGHYPTLDFTASRAFSDADGSTYGYPIKTTTNQYGLVLNVPLFQGGYVSSKVREAAARQTEATDRLEQTRRVTAQQARQSYLAVINGIARVQALEQARASNQRSLETTILGYERGARTGVDVLNTQRQLFGTRRDLAQARYNLLLARLQLKSAAGALSETDIADINRLFTNTPTNSAD